MNRPSAPVAGATVTTGAAEPEPAPEPPAPPLPAPAAPLPPVPLLPAPPASLPAAEPPLPLAPPRGVVESARSTTPRSSSAVTSAPATGAPVPSMTWPESRTPSGLPGRPGPRGASFTGPRPPDPGALVEADRRCCVHLMATAATIVTIRAAARIASRRWRRRGAAFAEPSASDFAPSPSASPSAAGPSPSAAGPSPSAAGLSGSGDFAAGAGGSSSGRSSLIAPTIARSGVGFGRVLCPVREPARDEPGVHDRARRGRARRPRPSGAGEPDEGRHGAPRLADPEGIVDHEGHADPPHGVHAPAGRARS